MVQNPNYQFITLRIHEDAEPGTDQIEFKRGDYSHTHEYEIKERSTDPNRNQGFDSSDVTYLLMPDLDQRNELVATYIILNNFVTICLGQIFPPFEHQSPHFTTDACTVSQNVALH
jgi:hypothetical protein